MEHWNIWLKASLWWIVLGFSAFNPKPGVPPPNKDSESVFIVKGVCLSLLSLLRALAPARAFAPALAALVALAPAPALLLLLLLRLLLLLLLLLQLLLLLWFLLFYTPAHTFALAPALAPDPLMT